MKRKFKVGDMVRLVDEKGHPRLINGKLPQPAEVLAVGKDTNHRGTYLIRLRNGFHEFWTQERWYANEERFVAAILAT